MQSKPRCDPGRSAPKDCVAPTQRDESAQRVEIQLHLNRCPYCHEDVRPLEEAWTACAGCLARHHEGCWSETGSCAACRHAAPLTQPIRRRVRPWLWRLFKALALLLLLFAGVAAPVSDAIPPPVTLTAPVHLDAHLDQAVRQLRTVSNEARRDAITRRRSNYLVFYREASGGLAVQRLRAGTGFVGEVGSVPAAVRVVETQGDSERGFSSAIKGAGVPIFDQLPDPGDPALFTDLSPRLDTGVAWIEIRRDGVVDSDPTRYVDFEMVGPRGQHLRVTLTPDGRVRVAVAVDY